MRAKIIEATGSIYWSKFLVLQWELSEWSQPSKVSEGSRVAAGHNWNDVFVIDLGTNEGAVFTPTGQATADLRKHRIWVSPLFGSFLTWLYEQSKHGSVAQDLDSLPSLVTLEPLPESSGSYRREGPLDELLKRCLKSKDPETRTLARTVWQGTHSGEPMPPGTPPTLADVHGWVGDPPESDERP